MKTVKIPKTTSKPPVVIVSIVRGKGTPAQQQLVRRFYGRLLAQVQDEIKNAKKESPPSQAPAKDSWGAGTGERKDG